MMPNPILRARRCVAIPAILTTLAAGCGADAPTTPGGGLAAEPAQVASRSAKNCETVGGAIAGNFADPGGFSLQGLGTARVTVVGLDAKGARGQGAIHSVVTHQIDTPTGTIMTSDEGVLAPVAPPLYRLNHRWTIVDGTGEFGGANGFLHPHASIDLATGAIEGFYHGRICA